MSRSPKYKYITVLHPTENYPVNLPLHVYVWLVGNNLWSKGQVTTPDGYAIHHKDFNHLNNDLSNLQLVTYSEHTSLHWQADREEKVEAFKNRMASLTPEKIEAARVKRTASMKAYHASLTEEERKTRMAKIRIHHQKLTEDDVRYIRANYKKRDRGGVGQLCAKFDISASHIRQIVSRRLFPNVN